MQWALCPLQWLGTRPNGTLGELGLRHARQALEVVVARIAEVGSTEAEVDSYRATVAALVLQIIHTMLRTHLCGAMDNYMYYYIPIIKAEPTQDYSPPSTPIQRKIPQL